MTKITYFFSFFLSFPQPSKNIVDHKDLRNLESTTLQYNAYQDLQDRLRQHP